MNEGPIEPPRRHPRRALARGAAEAVVELIPGASLLTNVLAVTHPPIDELERQQWEVDMTRRTNELDKQLAGIVGAYLRMHSNFRHASEAQQLAFVRGGMISTLEV